MPCKEAELIKKICVQSGMLLECVQWNEEVIEKTALREELQRLSMLTKQLDLLLEE